MIPIYTLEKCCRQKEKLTCEIGDSAAVVLSTLTISANRLRHILKAKAVKTDEHWFELYISTSAGTYVKEFVHGDMGRTRPSVSSILGCKTDIVQLDCVGIQFDG